MLLFQEDRSHDNGSIAFEWWSGAPQKDEELIWPQKLYSTCPNAILRTLGQKKKK